ncbi:NB-ARC domains-containing protein [Tanacetum coccineum]
MQLSSLIMVASSFHQRWKYDVFVSFKGEDIRKNFMDNLLNNFKQKGNHAFRDDNKRSKGEEIFPHLYKTIEESRSLIIIFSKNYASSSWCLREFVKILERKQNKILKHEVQIILYDVKPNTVRKQTRSYAEAFAKHELLNSTKVDKWKKLLPRLQTYLDGILRTSQMGKFLFVCTYLYLLNAFPFGYMIPFQLFSYEFLLTNLLQPPRHTSVPSHMPSPGTNLPNTQQPSDPLPGPPPIGSTARPTPSTSITDPSPMWPNTQQPNTTPPQSSTTQEPKTMPPTQHIII